MLLIVLLLGAFQLDFPMQQFPMGAAPLHLAVADLDRDGRPDLITCNHNASELTIRRGDGWGGFAELESHSIPKFPSALVVADVDGDGWPDVVTTSTPANRLSVLRGDGAGGLLPVENHDAGPAPGALAAGDIDGDGRADLVVGSASAPSFRVLFGAAAGALVPGPIVPTAGPPSSLALADVDGDGRLDVVATSAELVVHVGLGHGQFAPPRVESVYTEDVGLGDLDADGLIDAAVCANASNFVLLLADGTGGFAPEQKLPACDPLHDPVGMLIVDLDEDAHADVVVSCRGDDMEFGALVALRRGDGTGALGPVETTVVAEGSSSFVAADVVVDGNLDLVLVPLQSESVLVLPGKGPDGLPSVTVSNPGPGPYDLALGDANGDGLTDVATTFAYYPSAVRLLTGDGQGGFGFAWQDSALAGPRVARFADANGDGALDLAVAGYAGSCVYAGDGTGHFGTSPAVTLATSGDARGLFFGDLDGDGDSDVVTADDATDQLAAFRGHGDFSFEPLPPSPVGAGPLDLQAADLDGDGLPDLVTASGEASTLSIWSVGSAPVSQLVVPAGVRGLDLGDVDEDGVVDAVVAAEGKAVSLLLGDGLGGLPVSLLLPTDVVADDLLIADLDEDGHADLALTDPARRAVALLRGTGAGQFGASELLATGGEPRFLEAADVDGDDRLDLLTIIVPGGGLVVHRQLPHSPVSLVAGGASGLFGEPLLKLLGELEAGAHAQVVLVGAAPRAPVMLVVGTRLLLAPFKAGVLVPSIDLAMAIGSTDAEGGLVEPADWPPGIPPGQFLALQAWLPDVTAPAGWAGSSGVAIVTP